jgi:hypothetical protein
MFFPLLCFQYINTKVSHKRLILSGESPETNVTIQEPNASDYDGVLQVTYDKYFGYDLSGVVSNGSNITLWTQDIAGSVVCGIDGHWQTFFESKYPVAKDLNPIGLFILFLETIAISLALTGIWPLMISMSEAVNTILQITVEARLENLEEDNEQRHDLQNRAIEPRWRRIFKYAWLIASFVVIVFLSAVLGHLITLFVGFPTFMTHKTVGSCFLLDTSTLGEAVVPGGAKRVKSILEDNGEITANSAQARINNDGSVDFVTNCEASMYQASTGAIWTLVPQTGVTCVDSPGYELVNIIRQTQNRCTWWESWDSQVHEGTYPGYTEHIKFENWQYGSCGTGNMHSWTHRSWVSWKLDWKTHWQFCKSSTQPGALVRKGPDGKVEEIIHFGYQLTVDPNSFGRQYGWYTSGDREIITHATFSSGGGAQLIFYTPPDWREYMKAYHIPGSTSTQPTVNWPFDASVQPSAFECKTLFNLPNGNDFEEFRQYCSNTWATLADDDVSGIKIMTSSELWCTVDVGFGADDWSTLVTIKLNHPVTLLGADRWRCTTQVQFGLDCSANKSFSLFDAEIVNATQRTIVESVGNVELREGPNTDLSELVDWLDFSDIGDIVSFVVVCIVIIIVGIVVVVIIVKIIRCACKRRSRNTVVVTESSDEGHEHRHGHGHGHEHHTLTKTLHGDSDDDDDEGGKI